MANLGDTKLFTAYGAGHVMVNGERYERSIVVLAGEVHSDRVVVDFDALSTTHFDYFLQLFHICSHLSRGGRRDQAFLKYSTVPAATRVSLIGRFCQMRFPYCLVMMRGSQIFSTPLSLS
ncbi:MAG: hypothetical protein ABI536_08785 [Gallionella sp.]